MSIRLVGSPYYDVRRTSTTKIVEAIHQRASSPARTHATCTPVLISETLWREWLGDDPQVLGRPLIISGRPAIVIGVLPASFT